MATVLVTLTRRNCGNADIVTRSSISKLTSHVTKSLVYALANIRECINNRDAWNVTKKLDLAISRDM